MKSILSSSTKRVLKSLQFTSGDGLTRRVRSMPLRLLRAPFELRLRRRYGYPKGFKKRKWGVPVVFSPEEPRYEGALVGDSAYGQFYSCLIDSRLIEGALVAYSAYSQSC